jgi:hypothetical protein
MPKLHDHKTSAAILVAGLTSTTRSAALSLQESAASSRSTPFSGFRQGTDTFGDPGFSSRHRLARLTPRESFDAR